MFEFEVNWETPFKIRFTILKDDTFEINDITLFNVSLTHKQYENFLKEHGGMVEIEQECRDFADNKKDWRY